MKKLCNRIAFLSSLLFMIVAVGSCSTVPSPTAMVPTSAPPPTATRIPSTKTPVLNPPRIINLEDLTISDGEHFPKIILEDYVTDEDHVANEIDWQISGNEDLEVITAGGNLFVMLPQGGWTGSETLRFVACDPDGSCDEMEIVFTVRAENDAPVVSLFGQIIMLGESFTEIDLDDLVHDEDNEDDELIWNVNGQVNLSVTISERIATIELPEAEWLGHEVIRFEVCDPEGACDAREALYWVMERTSEQVEVVAVGNAGYLITVGETKILIDALYEGNPLTSEIPDLLRTAQPPFNDVDLILTTHIHHDHFHQDMVISHMENNPGAVFISGPDVVSLVTENSNIKDRTIPIQIRPRVGEKMQVVVDEIGVESLYLDHGDGTFNLGFIITVNGRRLFHTGDMDPDSVSVSQLEGLGLPDKQIDIAFVAHSMLITEEQHAHILEGIRAKHVVPMHYQFTYPMPNFDLMKSYFPNVIIFYEPMDNWVLKGTSFP